MSLRGAIMADITTDEVSYPADTLTGGILAGLFSHFLSREVDCIQSQCAKHGHSASNFILSSPERVDAVRKNGASGKTHSQILDDLLLR